MTIKIDKTSLRVAVKRAKFPSYMDAKEIEKTVENDLKNALRMDGIKSGTYKVSLGRHNYDVIVGKDGKRRIRHIKISK